MCQILPCLRKDGRIPPPIIFSRPIFFPSMIPIILYPPIWLESAYTAPFCAERSAAMLFFLLNHTEHIQILDTPCIPLKSCYPDALSLFSSAVIFSTCFASSWTAPHRVGRASDGVMVLTFSRVNILRC